MQELQITRDGKTDHKMMLKYRIVQAIRELSPKIEEFFETQGGHTPRR